MERGERSESEVPALKRIIVFGFYDNCNMTQNQYKLCFQHIFQKYKLHNSYQILYLNYDFLKNNGTEICDTDIIVLGGGEVLNSYFLNLVNDVFYTKSNKILAVSVGLPFTDLLINTNKLSLIDFVFLRTTQEISLFSQYFHPKRIIYFPDISFLLLDICIDYHTQRQLNYRSHVKVGHMDNDLKNRDIREYRDGESRAIRRNSSISNTSYDLSPDVNRELSGEYIQICEILDNVKYCGTKILALSLNRHIYSGKHVEYYDQIVSEFAKCIVHWVRHRYYIVFLPFNTYSLEQNHCEARTNEDLIFHQDIIDGAKHLLGNKTTKCLNLLNNVMNIQCTLPVTEVFLLYKFFYATIPMRFHACLFSIYNMVPMLPVFSSKDICNLLLDISWEHMYQVDCNEGNIFTGIKANKLIALMDTLEENISPNITTYIHCWPFDRRETHPKKTVENTLCDACVKFKVAINNGSAQFIHAITKRYTKVATVGFKNPSSKIVSTTLHTLEQIALRETGNINFRLVKDRQLQQLLVNVTSYMLTNSFDSPYNSELETKLFDTKYCDRTFDDLMSIKRQIQCKQPILPNNKETGLFNINFVEQYNSLRMHSRSGWQYVCENIKDMHSNSSSLLLDLFVDKTFHWKKECYQEVGIIPYIVPWIGFIHHTFDTSFSEYNNSRLFQCKEFLDSLNACKGFIVMSKTLQLQMTKYLLVNNIKNTPVFTMNHPIDLSYVEPFQWDKFVYNKDKKLLHIGSWLRNVFAFYELKLPRKLRLCNVKRKYALFTTFFSDGIRKCMVKGLRIDNYFPNHETFYEKIIRKGDFANNDWDKHFAKHLDNTFRDIEIIQRLDDDPYDEILTKNIVFINLVDASAVNTILECIIRNTPIIVNRHPAVVELLGEEYPLYYTSFDVANSNCYSTMSDEINKLLRNTNNIRRASSYLKKLDKSRFDIKLFRKHLKEIVTSVL